MLIEYKIKFEKNGVTITQRVEPGSSGAIAAPKAVAAHASVKSPAGSVQLGSQFVAPAVVPAGAPAGTPAAAPAVVPKPAIGAGNVPPPGTGEGNTKGSALGS